MRTLHFSYSAHCFSHGLWHSFSMRAFWSTGSSASGCRGRGGEAGWGERGEDGLGYGEEMEKAQACLPVVPFRNDTLREVAALVRPDSPF